ncbi:GAF domain-containing protein [Microlunatus elymi]|uniref:GAF domain-containing protein n=1 Tax=Microlunatus elymi TaxID=2596828 RepID=A0A516Q416_9ACTN|nr:GAF domain-containing protein [Microlunatus elymi]QDP98112.1 GAF domain-containing protein [Microlunatus elymi]
MDFNLDLDHATSVFEVAAEVRHLARRSCRADGATFVLRDGDFCFYVDEDAIAPLWKGQRFPIESCISGWAMLHAEPAVIADIFTDERIPQEAYRPTFVRSLLMMPVGLPTPLAAIGCYWSTNHQATIDEIAALEALAVRTAEALDRVGVDDAPWAPNFGLPRPHPA